MSGDNVNMFRARINMYMYKDPMKYTIAVFPYAGVLSSYDFNSSPSNNTTSLYGNTNNQSREVIKMSFRLVSLYGRFVFPYAEAKLLSIMLILSSAEMMLPAILIALTYVDTIFPYVDMLSAYGVNVFLDRGNVSPYAERTSQYADVKKMGGRSVKMGNEMTSTHDGITLPSAGVAFPFGVMIKITKKISFFSFSFYL
ncbi:hypothetical protein FXV77_00725 [Sphingobacterium phlebotomi]|uniref:Uncharacterized protein n=1 Tax=Sphingobacterium phlebotomi TaxID=2605433 RepID=A0A5D4HE40_9SPHI|nr:hypothetical protein [Sphingobacterium phlebotomi]TYR37845.1 hypothetical protein FXV77_00725 [Sphingobacterium phlebotomi]